MRPSIASLAGLFLSTTLLGCGASATIPQPPSNAKPGPPPGTAPDMANTKQGNAPGGTMTGGMLGPTKPAAKRAR